MGKILMVGDVHLSPRTPISRKDNYSDTILNKISSITSIILEREIKHVVFLGDLFNTRHMTLPYFIKCFQQFKEMEKAGAQLHTIVGNHDIYYNNQSTMEDSPMQILFDSGLFSNESFQEGNTKFTLVNYTTNTSDLPKAEVPADYNILVGHYFYQLGFGDEEHTISKQQANHLGYASYWLGHDHTPYEPLHIDGYDVHRPGSLSRGSSNTCQLNRESIKVVIFDSDSHEYNYIDLPNILDSKSVYKENNLINKIDMFTLDESLETLLQSFTFDNSSDIIETLNSLELDDELYQLVMSYLNSEGIYSKEVS